MTYIRVFPMTSVGGNCLRLDVYGCDGGKLTKKVICGQYLKLIQTTDI